MNDMMSHIGAILTVGLLLAQVSSEKFRQEDVGEKNLARVNSTKPEIGCWCNGRIDASLKTSVRRCNVTITGIGVFCCGSLGNSVTIGWGEGEDTVKTFPLWVSAAEFNETHVYNTTGSKTFTITAASQLLHNSCGTTYLRYRKITVKIC